ncbi:response regulator transcription factor [Nostoc sp.]|uniref:response regulator transcription factor n=1 Tax=Nostoc sp. TaxID=1180 RepID=UPI002FF6E1E8
MKKILLIEEEIQSRKFFLNCLNTEGFHTISAENGVSGIQSAKKLLPDLVICDVVMQEVDGYSVLSKLRQHPATAVIPFIFITAKGSYTDIRRGMELGADDYIIRPCKIEEILKAITTQLEKQRIKKQWYSHETESAESKSLRGSQSIFPNCSQLNQVFQFIEENYYRPIKLTDIALVVGYSPAYLTNLVKRKTQRSVYRWITERRMVEARLLLMNTDEPVNQIASRVGYSDAGYFIRQFRQLYKIPPKAWREAQG